MNDNNDTRNKNKLIPLCNGRSVYPDIFDYVRSVAQERSSELSPDTPYTLKQICGEDLWGTLSKINKIDAGYCMVHLVKKREVPFKAVEGRHEYPKLYRLTSTQLGTRIP